MRDRAAATAGGGTKHKTERKEEGDGRRKGREGEKRSEVGE